MPQTTSTDFRCVSGIAQWRHLRFEGFATPATLDYPVNSAGDLFRLLPFGSTETFQFASISCPGRKGLEVGSWLLQHRVWCFCDLQHKDFVTQLPLSRLVSAVLLGKTYFHQCLSEILEFDPCGMTWRCKWFYHVLPLSLSVSAENLPKPQALQTWLQSPWCHRGSFLRGFTSCLDMLGRVNAN